MQSMEGKRREKVSIKYYFEGNKVVTGIREELGATRASTVGLGRVHEEKEEKIKVRAI